MFEGKPVMETLRALLNLEGDGYKLVSIVLAGLEPLVAHLAADPALVARIACHATLAPFAPHESLAYVQHRLHKAGASTPLFDEPILQRVHALAGGVPRLINTLCDNMLLRLARLGHTEASLGLLDDIAKRLHVSAPRPAQGTAAPRENDSMAGGRSSDLLSQVDDIAARLAQGESGIEDEVTPPLGITLPAETTVDLPGDSWPGLSVAGDFLGNTTPPEGLDPRGGQRTDDDVVISILGEAQRRFKS